jgi:hypothetical protein
MQEDRVMRGKGIESALILPAAVALFAQSPAEDLIEAGHWKRARALVEARMREAPEDPLAIYLMSQIRFAFGDANTPLKLAEKAWRSMAARPSITVRWPRRPALWRNTPTCFSSFSLPGASSGRSTPRLRWTLRTFNRCAT